jgi:hypothetical protein
MVGDGRGETLWLRPANLPPPDPASLAGDPDRLTEVVRLARGLVVAGGPDVDSARSAVYALAGLLAARRPGSVAIVSRDVTYRAPASAGPCTRVTPAGWPELVRAARPDLAVLDPGLASGQIRIEDLECVPRVLAGAVGSGIAALATRLIARLTAGETSRGQAALGTTPIGVVMATPTGEDGGRLPFTARLLSDAQRIAALRGDAGALAAVFAGT